MDRRPLMGRGPVRGAPWGPRAWHWRGRQSQPRAHVSSSRGHVDHVRHVCELPSDGRRGGPREPPEPAMSPRVGLTRPRGKTPKEPKGYPQEPQEANHVRHPSNSTRGPHQRAT
eukprot:scaffold54758_cov53-Phaeocystis_antarctica.AAC.3